MVYGIYQSAAGLQVNQYRQEVLANNLANVSTVGFKPALAVLSERQVASREGRSGSDASDRMLDEMTGGLLVAPTYTSFEQGAIDVTGSPLDVALTEDGFFVVQDGEGERYTRDGRFTINAAGELVTVAGGLPVLDESGSTIVAPRGLSARLRIDANGQVRSGDSVLGRLRTVVFEDQSLLRPRGGNLFEAMGAQATDQRVRLQAGAVESSAVEPMQAMVSLMQVARAYERNATMVGLADSTLNRAVNDIARIR